MQIRHVLSESTVIADHAKAQSETQGFGTRGHIFDPATYDACRLSVPPLTMQASAQHGTVDASFLHMTSMVLSPFRHCQLSEISNGLFGRFCDESISLATAVSLSKLRSPTSTYQSFICQSPRHFQSPFAED